VAIVPRGLPAWVREAAVSSEPPETVPRFELRTSPTMGFDGDYAIGSETQ